MLRVSTKTTSRLVSYSSSLRQISSKDSMKKMMRIIEKKEIETSVAPLSTQTQEEKKKENKGKEIDKEMKKEWPARTAQGFVCKHCSALGRGNYCETHQTQNQARTGKHFPTFKYSASTSPSSSSALNVSQPKDQIVSPLRSSIRFSLNQKVASVIALGIIEVSSGIVQ